MKNIMKTEPAASRRSISSGTIVEGVALPSKSYLDSSSFEQESERFVGFMFNSITKNLKLIINKKIETMINLILLLLALSLVTKADDYYKNKN